MGYVESIEKTATQKKIRKGSDNVNIRFPRLMIHSLQWVSVGYSSALYFAGKKLGHDVLSKNVAGKDIKSIISGMAKIFSEYGIGKLEIKEAGERNISVTLKDSVTASGMKPVGKTVCFFEAGIIAGIVEARTGTRATVNEVLCGGLGDSVEEFLIKLG